MTGLDLCPRCGAYAQPMVWLGKGKGFICEDCYDKEVKENESDCNCNHINNMCDNRDSVMDWQQ